MWRRPLVTVLAFAPAALIVFLAVLKRWSAAQMFKTLCDIAFCIGVVLTVAATIAMFARYRDEHEDVWSRETRREYVDWARRHIGDEFLQGDTK